MPQAQTITVPKRLPLYAPLQTRTSNPPFSKDSRLYNGYAEFDPVIEGYQIYKRPGLGASQATTTGRAQGLYTDVGTNSVFSVFGGLAYVNIGSAGPLVNGFSVGIAADYRWATVGTNSVGNRYVVANGGGTPFYMKLQGGPLGSIIWAANYFTDVNFPGNTSAGLSPGWCLLNGRLYAMDWTGAIWGTLNANDPTVWSSTNVIQANNQADLGVALIRQLTYLIAFKQYSTQIFYDAGNPAPGSPLAPVPDAALPFGCLVGSSVQAIDNTIMWVTSNETISPQVMQMDNLVPKVVSTPDIDRVLDNITWTGGSAVTSFNLGNPTIANRDVSSWVLKHAGHRFYGLNLHTNNISLIYDLDQKAWYIWTDPNGNFWPITNMASLAPGNSAEGVHLAQHFSNGNIYPLDGDYNFPTDFGNVFPVDLYTPNYDGGTTRGKMLSMMYFSVDKFPGNKLQVRYSDDDYQSWSNFRTVDISKSKPRAADWGTFQQRRAFHFRHEQGTPLRMRAVELEEDICTL